VGATLSRWACSGRLRASEGNLISAGSRTAGTHAYKGRDCGRQPSVVGVVAGGRGTSRSHPSTVGLPQRAVRLRAPKPWPPRPGSNSYRSSGCSVDPVVKQQPVSVPVSRVARQRVAFAPLHRAG